MSVMATGLFGVLGLIMMQPAQGAQGQAQAQQTQAQTQTQPAQTPVNNAALPGQALGGALPIATTALAVEALSLAPSGLQAISVFPPFATPRTVNAVSVIFRENSAVSRRVKRGLKWGALRRTVRGFVSFFIM